MYSVSNAWANANNYFLAPEGFVELSCHIPSMKEALVYTKHDLMSFTHQQTGSLVTGELPKNHIEFTLDNSDGKWDPNNPSGLERYLSERLKITLRYGFDINGVVEWIPGGVFYLSEWRTSDHRAEASFVARDLLEYMLDRPYTGDVSGTLYDVAERAILEANVPANDDTQDRKTMILGTGRLNVATLGEVVAPPARLSEELRNFSVSDIEYDAQDSIAVILQKCANAACCVMYQDRSGYLVIEKFEKKDSGFTIPQKLSYSYPRIEFSRPIKNVQVSYFDDGTVDVAFSGSGVTQTLSNNFIPTKTQALTVAKWVYENLRTRKKIHGEFRGDPRFDLFDSVSVEDKYGTMVGVVLTDIKCTFSGTFRISYSGYIYGSGVATFVYSGEVYTGEVK
jgi:hypothetical protein